MRLAVELDRRGHEVTVFASGDSVVPGRLVATVPLPVRDTGAAGIHAIPWLATTLMAVMGDGERLDILHSHLDWAGLMLGHRSPVPVVATIHGRVDVPGSRALLAASRCHHVAISASQAGSHAPGTWSAVVHNGLDLTGSPFGEARSDDLCFVGRLVPEKGIMEAIETARLSGRHLRIAAKVGTPARGGRLLRASRATRHRGCRRGAPRRAVVGGARPAVCPESRHPDARQLARALRAGGHRVPRVRHAGGGAARRSTARDRSAKGSTDTSGTTHSSWRSTWPTWSASIERPSARPCWSGSPRPGWPTATWRYTVDSSATGRLTRAQARRSTRP